MVVKYDTKNEGFTLVELLGILVLVAIMGLLVFLTIDKSLKDGKQRAYDNQLEMIKLAAKSYLSDYSEELPNVGYSTEVKLGKLKVGGYVSRDILNPKNNECFFDDLIVRVTKPTKTKDYTYIIELPETSTYSSSNGKCTMNLESVIPEQPVEPTIPEDKTSLLVSIDGGTNYLSPFGDQTVFSVVYHKSVDDTRSREYIQISDNYSQTSSEIEIGEEKQLENGYKRTVTVKYNGGYPGGSLLTLEVKKGFVTTNSGESNAASKTMIIVSDVTPIVAISNEGVVSGTEFRESNRFNQARAYLTNQNACINMSGGNWVQVKDISIANSNKFDYINYMIGDGNNTYSNDTNNPQEYISFMAKKNGDYVLKACNQYNQCSEDYTLSFKNNDCLSPASNSDDSSELNSIYYDPFDDDNSYSGISKVYAFISSQKELESKYGEELSIKNEFDISKLIGTVGGVPVITGGEVTNETSDSVINMISNKFCGDVYLYYLVSDKANNINLFTDGHNYGANCPVTFSGIDIPESNPICQNDVLCRMKQRSEQWWLTTSPSYRVTLNNENLEDCSTINWDGAICYHNSSAGSYSVCKDDDNGVYNCTGLYSGIKFQTTSSEDIGFHPSNSEW